jgi:hypothetical protein
MCRECRGGDAEEGFLGEMASRVAERMPNLSQLKYLGALVVSILPLSVGE